MFEGTTIVCVRRGDAVAMAGDGQVTFGTQIIKAGAKKVRRLYKGSVLAGFAGSTADAMTLLERFENRLEENSGDLTRSAVAMVKEWRTDRALRRLEAMLLVADARSQRERAKKFREQIIPRAATVLKQAEFAFARGAIPLTDLLDARRTQRSTQLDALNAQLDAAKAETALLLRSRPELLVAAKP